MTKTIAFRAVSAWRQVLSALPASLGYSSLSEFLKKFTRDPVFSRGDKVSVHWLADGREYEAILRGFGGHGQCWVEFFSGEHAHIARQYLTKIESGEVDLCSQCSTIEVQL